MTNKLKAIGISFLVTVGPAIVLFGSIILAIPIVNNVFNNNPEPDAAIPKINT